MFCHSLKPTDIVITAEHSWMEKCTKFDLSILSKIIKNCCHQIPDFKADMHQIRLRLGLRPRPLWGSSQRSPDPLAGFKGPTSKGRGEGQGRGEERERGRGKGGIGKGENGKGEERKEEGRGKKMREGRRKVCLLLNGGLVTPLVSFLFKESPTICRLQRITLLVVYLKDQFLDPYYF